ncbi:hypothetical protein GCK72_008936 [Caenorhabditis remanei]|uniref:T-box domain-containing protein n=1 Tax=Caenorhabditis remanei TaxID=31234 RepID=A0A6A5H031_CAERE|nr:hypothetical protein GCK72_008936 [Caenorhabditis remanei]KAF1760687.1 hypothetical protein GCK72_008936 [Caenorhabditis remanei]
MSSIKVVLTPECQNMWAQRQGSMEMVSKGAKGTPLFPGLKFMIDGMEDKSNYSISLTLERVDSTRLTFKNGSWTRSEVRNSKDAHPYKCINHPDGIQTGEYWRSHPIEFDQLRITSKVDLEKQDENMLFVRTMYRYVAVLTVNDMTSGPIRIMVHTAQFIPVSIYQDNTIGRWKSQYNKFATIGNGGLGAPGGGKVKKSKGRHVLSSPITPVTTPIAAYGTQYPGYNTGFYPMSNGYNFPQVNYSYPVMTSQYQCPMSSLQHSGYGGSVTDQWNMPTYPPTATPDITAAHWPQGSSMASSMTAAYSFYPSSSCSSGSSSPGASMNSDFNGYTFSKSNGSPSGLSPGYSTTTSPSSSSSRSSGSSSPVTSVEYSFDGSTSTRSSQSPYGSFPGYSTSTSLVGSITPSDSSDDSTSSLFDGNVDYSIAFKPYEFLTDDDIPLPY